jgi:glutaminyl-peptide cyclotransferase
MKQQQQQQQLAKESKASRKKSTSVSDDTTTRTSEGFEIAMRPKNVSPELANLERQQRRRRLRRNLTCFAFLLLLLLAAAFVVVLRRDEITNKSASGLFGSNVSPSDSSSGEGGNETDTDANVSVGAPSSFLRSSFPTVFPTVAPSEAYSMAPSEAQQMNLPPKDAVPIVSPSPTVPDNIFLSSTSAPTTTPSSNPTLPPVPNPTLPPIPNPTTPAPTNAPTTSSPSSSPTETPLTVTQRGSFQLLETLPHDPTAFTQGLEVLSLKRLQYPNVTAVGTTTSSNYFVESTGVSGESTLRVVDVTTGSVVEQLDLHPAYFGEGCTYYQTPSTDPNVIKLKIVQLTWQSGIGIVYELDITTETSGQGGAVKSLSPVNLQYVGTFEIDTTSGEGWGIVYHPTLDQFIVSDGTENLHFWKLRQDTGGNLSFERVRTLPVQRRFSADEEWAAVQRLNELEWDPHSQDGMTVLANVWQTQHIVRIRLEDGLVSNQYHLTTLERPTTADVMNGIAAVWDSSSTTMTGNDPVDEFWITGKYWPNMYRVRLVD